MTTSKTKALTKFERLCAGILSNSSDPNISFTQARDEWEFLFVLKNDNGKCLCGKNIFNECHIQNQINNKTLIVGSDCLTRVCVKGKYINEVQNLFTTINLFIREKKLDKLLIEYCKEKSIITDWEYQFSLDTHYKRQLSDKQKARKEVIDNKILKSVSSQSTLGDNKLYTEDTKIPVEKPKLKKPIIK